MLVSHRRGFSVVFNVGNKAFYLLFCEAQNKTSANVKLDEIKASFHMLRYITVSHCDLEGEYHCYKEDHETENTALN
jgi:hypothetical protein